MNTWNVKGGHVEGGFDLVSDTSEIKSRTCLVFYMISSSFRDDSAVWWAFPKGRILNL